MTRKYEAAAKQFLAASLDHCDCPDLISPNNVAIYGGLTALATFDRAELLKQVISSTQFKLFLELEPQLRDVIQSFYESRWENIQQPTSQSFSSGTRLKYFHNSTEIFS